MRFRNSESRWREQPPETEMTRLSRRRLACLWCLGSYTLVGIFSPPPSPLRSTQRKVLHEFGAQRHRAQPRDIRCSSAPGLGPGPGKTSERDEPCRDGSTKRSPATERKRLSVNFAGKAVHIHVGRNHLAITRVLGRGFPVTHQPPRRRVWRVRCKDAERDAGTSAEGWLPARGGRSLLVADGTEGTLCIPEATGHRAGVGSL